MRELNHQNATGVQTYLFNGTFEVQIIIINGEPHFVAVDVCTILGLQNVTDTLKKVLDKDEYLTYIVSRAGQQRSVNVVNESGIYALIFQSRKPIAKVFRKWVTKEVLPSIRKTGSYSVQPKLTDLPFNDGKYSIPTDAVVFTCTKPNGTIGHIYLLWNLADFWFEEDNVNLSEQISYPLYDYLKGHTSCLGYKLRNVHRQYISKRAEWRPNINFIE